MARPVKIGLDYFPVDVDMFEDEKMLAISGEFGIKGEITVVKLLCAIYRNGYYVLWNDLLKFKLLHDLPGISVKLIDEIVQRLVKWDFFDKNLFNSTDKVLTSVGIQKRYFEAVRNRNSKKQLPFLLVENSIEDKNEDFKVKKPDKIIVYGVKGFFNTEGEKINEDDFFKIIMHYFNQMAKKYDSKIHTLSTLSDTRRIKLRALTKEFSQEAIALGLKNATVNQFLNGRTSKRNKPADFDWIIDCAHFAKIIEGSI